MKQKKRHKFKKNGLPSGRYCQVCLSWGCNPMFALDTIATRKRMYRRRNNMCEGCGKIVCSCKNKKGF